MDEAIVVLSRKGKLKTRVRARDISSREHARKLWPLVTPESPHRIVTWVSPSFENNELVRRSHFRTLPKPPHIDLKRQFEHEENQRQTEVNESAEHKQAKKFISEALERRLQRGLAMPWYFLDQDASEFHLAGNLLLGAKEVKVEYKLSTSFGSEYRLDIAVLSAPIKSNPLVLGGVEIEKGHAFDGRKALIGKSQAFPLVSIDISDMTLEEITPEWADRALTATTSSNESGRRRTYIYLHDLLYPLYIQIPQSVLKEKSHQFLVFAKDKELKNLVDWLKAIEVRMALPQGSLTVSLVNAKSEQSKTMLENAGDVVGSDWPEINNRQCLRITIERPSSPLDINTHLFHIALSKLLLSHADTLVGYKYRTGIHNEHPEEDVWIYRKWDPEQSKVIEYRVLPKRLAEPSSRILDVLSQFTGNENT